MGNSPKPQATQIDTICQDLIKTISDSIASSYENKGILEPAYYLLNFILEKSMKQKKSFQPLLQAFTDPDLQMILNEQPMNENALKQHLNRINDAYARLYPTEKFDLAGKIKFVENISNHLNEDVVKEFFLNEGAVFWNKSFPNKDSINFEDFYEKFSVAVDFKDVFESVVPEAHKPNLKAITNNLKILMRDYLESDNNGFVMKEAWNVFHFKILTDYEMKVKFVENALVDSELQHNGIILRHIYLHLDGNLEKPIEYHISEKGLDYNGFDQTSKPKDLTIQQGIKIGRNQDQNDIILQSLIVSKQHCEIFMKQSLNGKIIRNDFYICNKSKFYTFFVVEEKGYQLGEKIVFNLSENMNFFVNAIYPGFKYNKKYYAVEPEYVEHKRKPMGNNLPSEQKKPFIDLHCVEDANLNKRFEVPEDNDYMISIGSGPNDTMIVHDIKREEDEEDVELMKANHCYIKYDSQEKCWVIQDRTVVLPGNKTFYKTFIKCERNEQYADPEGITMRGIKLINGMKFSIGDYVFQVEEVDKKA